MSSTSHLKKITDVIFCESPFDALAYYCLFGKYTETSLYVASMGNLCIGQLQELFTYIKKHRDKIDIDNIIFHLANDNDEKGALFNARFIHYYINQMEDVKVEHRVTNYGINEIEIILLFANLELCMSCFSKMQLSGNENIEIIIEKLEITVRNKSSDTCSKECFIAYVYNFLILEGLSLRQIKIEKPAAKDFNDDLMNINRDRAEL